MAATPATGTLVRHVDDTGGDTPVVWGVVVEPTTDELNALGQLEPEVETFVEWSPGYRCLEYLEDLVTR